MKQITMFYFLPNNYDHNGKFNDRIVNVSVLNTRVVHSYVSSEKGKMIVHNEYIFQEI